MYAVIRTGGKQYKVHKDQVLKVEKLEGAEGAEVGFEDVLLVSDGENITLGVPTVENAMVKARILSQGKSKKTLVFKYKRRKGYRKMRGHRQHYTQVRIEDIQV